jgi:hypothetical protein
MEGWSVFGQQCGARFGVDIIGTGQESVGGLMNIVMKIRSATERRKFVEYLSGCPTVHFREV